MFVPRLRSTLTLALAALVVAAPAAHAGKKPAPVTTVKTASGDLQTYVDEFVAGIPGRDSGGYDAPTSTERQTFMSAVESVLSQNLQQAATTLDPLRYDVVRYTDTATGREAVLLRERKVDGKYPNAWGLYAFANNASGLIVEVPHPVADVNTEDVGVQAFRAADARAVLLAGAHRYANGADPAPADMAHNTDSVFDAVHRRLLASGVRVLQPHGFGEHTRSLVGHDVVVSDGSSETSSVVVAVASALTGEGFSTCLYDGALCWQLGATTNVQGTSTRAAGAHFAHVESYTAIRTDSAQRDKMARTVAGVLK